LLAKIGFGGVTFKPPAKPGEPDKIVDDPGSPHPIAGYILSRGIDNGRNGRPVSFAFVGKPPKTDSAGEVFLKVPLLKKSLNWALMGVGHAYPMYYAETLPVDLREELTSQVNAARSGGLGFWPVNRATTATTVKKVEDLQKIATWPKLFRRLVSFFDGGGTKLSTFDSWLRAGGDERDDKLFIMSKAEYGNLHDVVEVKKDKIRMKFAPEELLVLSN
jgi:hypothetical protein